MEPDIEYDVVNEEPQWDIRTLADAYASRPPTEYIVDKFFATHTLNVVYGAPGVMKSLVMADLCACVVAGADWLPGVNNNGAGIPVKRSPVFWLDMDNGTRRTDERFEALGRAKTLDEDAPLYYVSMPNPHYDAGSTDENLRLMQVISGTGARLVVIDNLGLVTGEIEENSAKMAFIMGQLRTVAERTGAALVVIHHQRKGGAGTSRAGDALRGHSSIEAALDLALHIVREPNSSEITIKSTKTRGVDVPTVTGVFNFTHKPGTNDLQTAWYSGRQVIRGENPIRDAILDVLEEGEMTKGMLADRVHDALRGEYGINKIRNWIGEMIEVTKEIEVNTGERGAQILRLKNNENIRF